MQKLIVLLLMLIILSAWGNPIATAQGMTTSVINGGNLRAEPRLVPETVLGQVCPGDQVEVLTQQQALGALWYRVRITNTVLDCHSKRVPLNSEGWLSSSLLAPPQLKVPTSLPSSTVTAPSSNPTANPTATATSAPSSLLSVIQRGSLRTEIGLTPKTVIGEVCPGGIVALMGQQQAGGVWYRVRLTKMGPACADQKSMPIGKEGWLNSALVGPFQTPTPTATSSQIPPPTATSAALLRASAKGLIVYYSFDRPAQAGMLLDESDSKIGTDARTVGYPQYVAEGHFGGAYAFRSGNYFAAAQNPTAGLAAFTVALWFKTADPLENYKLASAATWNGGPGSGWVIGTHYPELWSEDGASIKLDGCDFGSLRLFKANEWNHLVLTYDSSKLKGYINGQLVRDCGNSGQPLGDGTQLTVGSWNGFPFEGLLDDFRIYNRAISAEEVGQLGDFAPLSQPNIIPPPPAAPISPPTATSAALSPAGAPAAGDSPAVAPAEGDSRPASVWDKIFGGCCISFQLFVWYNILAYNLVAKGFARHKFKLKGKIPGKPLPEGEVLTTAEASMLIDSNLYYPNEVIEPALRELLFQQLIELRTEEHNPFLQVTPGALNRLPRESPLYRVLKAFADHGKLNLVFFQDQEMEFNLRREDHQKFWDDLSDFKDHIRSHLVNRGLLEVWVYEHKLWFALVPPTVTLYGLTQSGEALSLRLKAQLGQARLIPQLLESNPAQATELILSLGNLLLLVNELKPHYARLATILHNQQYSILETFDKIIVNIPIPPPQPSND